MKALSLYKLLHTEDRLDQFVIEPTTHRRRMPHKIKMAVQIFLVSGGNEKLYKIFD